MNSTGDKFTDLYELSKTLQQFKWRKDKSRDDYEFEKDKEECTFVPNVTRVVGESYQSGINKMPSL